MPKRSGRPSSRSTSRSSSASRSGGGSCANIRPCARRRAAARRLISYKTSNSRQASMGGSRAEGRAMGKVVMYSTVSVDGFIADENDQPGPLFDWLSSGDVPLDETGQVNVSQASYDYTRPNWDQ